MAPDQIHLWLSEIGPPSAADLAVLDVQERARAARFVRGCDRQRFVSRRAWLRRLLATYLDLPPARIEYRSINNDKPVLAPTCGAPDLHFNLSHSDGLALCAVSTGHPCGVDIERKRELPDYLDIARRNFGPREFDLVRADAGAAALELFFDCWTRKEAFIKATGEGLSRALDSFDVALDQRCAASVHEGCGNGQTWYVYRLSPRSGVAAALCSQLPAARLSWIHQAAHPATAGRPTTC